MATQVKSAPPVKRAGQRTSDTLNLRLTMPIPGNKAKSVDVLWRVKSGGRGKAYETISIDSKLWKDVHLDGTFDYPFEGCAASTTYQFRMRVIGKITGIRYETPSGAKTGMLTAADGADAAEAAAAEAAAEAAEQVEEEDKAESIRRLLEKLPLRAHKTKISLESLCAGRNLDVAGSRKKLVTGLIDAGGPTVPQLQDLCREHGLPFSGATKPLLVSRLREKLDGSVASATKRPATDPVAGASAKQQKVACKYGACCRTKGCKYDHGDVLPDKLPADGESSLLAAKERASTEGSKAVWDASKANSDNKLAALDKKGREHLDVDPVYLGGSDCKQYSNLRELISTNKLHKRIQNEFRNMSAAEYQAHPLSDYFEPRTDNKPGYRAKMISTGILGEGKDTMFDIDHIVPRRWGGIDHPRNMAVMHRSMNRSFQDSMPEAKWFYLQSRSSGILRQVANFVKEVLHSKEVQTAIKDYIENKLSEKH